MSQTIERLSIFLASPGDVSDERGIVRDVVAEVNRTVAREKGVHLDVIGWDTDSFPSYGADGQALVNDQIADMARYDLFVGVLWNRFGTPTPRADSGTEEEFDRAEASFMQIGQPHIMFYFCQRPFQPKSMVDLEQKGKVFQFRQRVQSYGLSWDYADTAEFRKLYQRHLQSWLAQRTATTPNPPSQIPGDDSIPPTTPTGLPPARVSRQQAVAPPPASTAGATRRSLNVVRPQSVGDSGAWVLLGTGFFESNSVVEKSGGRISIEIAPRDTEEDALLRALQPGERHTSGGSVPFAYQNSGGIAAVISADRQSIAGATVWAVVVQLEQSTPTFMSEIGYNGLSADDIARLRARLILLNEDSSSSDGSGGFAGDPGRRLHQSFVRGAIGGGREAPESSPITDLWQRFQGREGKFLPLARLWAIYHLVTTNTVEHVLDLVLGPIQDGRLHVRFRGRRHPYYANVAPAEIAFEGDCDLSAPGVRGQV